MMEQSSQQTQYGRPEKSGAGCAYSYLSYVCAWLKANYPVEFFTALMSCRSSSMQPELWASKATEYIAEAKELGLNIFAPSINHSSYEFTSYEHRIYFGFSGIRDVSSNAIKSILDARHEQGQFRTIKDFFDRINVTKVNTRVFAALVNAGVFDRLGYRRKDLLTNIEGFYQYKTDVASALEREYTNRERALEAENIEAQIARRDELRLKLKKIGLAEEEATELASLAKVRRQKALAVPVPEFPKVEQHKKVPIDVDEIILQAYYIGCYIDIHPTKLLYPDSQSIVGVEIGWAKIAGVITAYKQILDKNKRAMAFTTITDGTSEAEIVIFSSQLAKLTEQKIQLGVGNIISCEGTVDSIDPLVKVRGNKFSKYKEPT